MLSAQASQLLPDLESASADAVIRWAVDRFGHRLVLATSMTDAVMIDLVTRIDPDIEVAFIDTGFHFAQTLATMRQAVARHQLRITVERPDHDRPDVWRHGPEACCAARKVAPLERILAGRAAWLSGIRRADGPTRATTPKVEIDRRGLVKVNPIADWTDHDVDAHIATHDIIVNPLVAQGYPSIGCWPCTEPAAGDDPRSGRWTGTAKTECGLHR